MAQTLGGKAARDPDSVPQPHQGNLYDMKSDEHHSKEEALVQHRIDERLISEPRSELEMLSDKQNFCKDKCIDDRKGMLAVIQMTL